MGYCFMAHEKIKSTAQLASRYKHDQREVNVANADPEKKRLNEWIMQTPVGLDGKHMDYAAAFQHRIEQLDYYKTHKIRSNAVLALDIVLSFSRKDIARIDLDAWKRANVKWLNDTFNIAPDGYSNVMSVTYHGDEEGSVHCHAMVVPVDDNGHLNARAFINGARRCMQMQSDYAVEMEQFGLIRGVPNSQASHRDIKKFYTNLNEVLKIAEPKKGETAYAFRGRVMDDIAALQAANLKRISDEYEAHKRRMSKERELGYQEMQREEVVFHKRLEIQNEQLFKKKNMLMSELANMQSEKEQLSVLLTALQQDIINGRLIKKKADAFDKLNEQLEKLEKENYSEAEKIRKDIDKLIRGKSFVDYDTTAIDEQNYGL